MSERSTIQTAPDWLASLRLRPLEAADLPGLEWEGAYTHFRRVYAQAYARAEAGQARLWVAALEDNYLLGQVFVLLHNRDNPEVADGRRRAFIHSFRVRPEYRGVGLGTRLLAHAEADLGAAGFTSASLNVARDNPGALRFYRRHGYRRLSANEGRWSYEDHRGHLRTVHEPSWRMRKDLLSSA